MCAGALVSTQACDLCAINSATTARAEATGFVFTLGSQYISAGNLQLNSQSLPGNNPEFLDTSVIHFIPGFNFTRDLGVSLNIPLVRKDFQYFSKRFGTSPSGRSEGLGDLSLIGRWTPWSYQTMTKVFRINALAGAKFPTGDTAYLKQDLDDEKFYDLVYGPGHNHLFSGVHPHDLTLGSGSVDGVFGLTTYARWQRLYATTEAQYYLRTAGEGDFRFGDTVMVAGGPGVYAIIQGPFTLSLQGLVRFENTEHSSYGSKPAGQTGMREIYAGPQIGITVGSHFSGQAGADLPIDIRNRGLQTVPDFRVHASVTWSF